MRASSSSEEMASARTSCSDRSAKRRREVRCGIMRCLDLIRTILIYARDGRMQGRHIQTEWSVKISLKSERNCLVYKIARFTKGVCHEICTDSHFTRHIARCLTGDGVQYRCEQPVSHADLSRTGTAARDAGHCRDGSLTSARAVRPNGRPASFRGTRRCACG